MNVYDLFPHAAIEDETELPGDDLSVDEVMEASFEHAQDEWMEVQEQ